MAPVGFSGRWGWLVQAVSGVMVAFLVGLHWIANHFLVKGGLQSYSDVVAYLRQPLAFALETVFLLAVTTHALLGLRAILLDLGPSQRKSRAMTLSLAALGVGTVLYGLSLTIGIVTK